MRLGELLVLPTRSLTGFLQDAALVALDEVACRVYSSRKGARAGHARRRRQAYERRYYVDPRSVIDLAGSVLPG